VLARREHHGLAERTTIVCRSLEELPLADRVQELEKVPNIENGDPAKDSAWLQVIGWAKPRLLAEAAAADPYGTRRFAWIDMGIAHIARSPRQFPAPADRPTILQMRPVFEEELTDLEDFYRYERGRLAAGLIRGNGDQLTELAEHFEKELDQVLGMGRRTTEQMILGALSARHPDSFAFTYGDYASVLINWDLVRGDARTVLENIAHCRRFGHREEALSRCQLLRRSIGAGAVTLHPQLLEWLANEEQIAEGSERRRNRSPSVRDVPEVSVVVPVHDGAATLERAVRSALGQTFTHLEVVIVDDASTDDSWAIATRLADEDPRVVLVRRHENSGGPATPRDDGIAASRGEFVALLDHDDYWLPDKLRRQMPLFDEQTAVVYSGAYFDEGWGPLGRTSRFPEGDLTEELLHHSALPALTAVVRREWVNKVGRFDKDGILGADDHYYWIRIALNGGTFRAVTAPLAVHTRYPSSLGQQRWREIHASNLRMRELVSHEFPECGMPAPPTVALCMIVRNEAAVIARCIESVCELIDTWVIVDTGSTDDTEHAARAALAGIPGTWYERPWRDFGANRTELMELARGAADYLLLIDADMTVVVHSPLPWLEADAYLLSHDGMLGYEIPRLVRGDLAWRYDGATHEHLAADEPFGTARFSAITVEHHGDGSSRSVKLTRDRDLLEAQLRRTPDDPRTVFYLAQTYRDLGEASRATDLYRRRVALGGWEEEVFYAAFQFAVLVAEQHWPTGLELLVEAWERRPSRVEPLYEIATRARDTGDFALCDWATSMALDSPMPADVLFVHRWVYEWGIRFERSIACGQLGRHDEALSLIDELLCESGLPEDVVEALLSNKKWSEERTGFRSVIPRSPGSTLQTLGEICEGVEMLAMPEVRGAQDSGWPQTNPSIAADWDGFRAIVRSVNYEMVDGRYTMTDGGEVVRTANYLLQLDSQLSVRDEVALEEPDEPLRHATAVAGFEDCRLFSWQDRWWATATSRDLDPEGRCMMVLLSIEGPRAEVSGVLPGPVPGRHEKNWMPFVVEDELCFVYSCRPFSVLHWDADRCRLDEVATTATDYRFAGLRGSSQGLAVDDGYLFVAHQAQTVGNHRRYSHRFIAVGPSLRPTGISPPFSFVHDGIEFCGGIASREDDVLLSFGIDDRRAALAVLSLDAVIDLIEPIALA